MQIVPLQAIPKQNLSVVLDDILFEIDLLETAGCMSLNLTRAGVVVAQGQRCVAGQLCLPYFSMEDGQGNFLFLTQNDVLPSYPDFGTTQFLLYATNAELAAVRATPQVVLVRIMAAATIAGAATVDGVGHAG